MTDYASFIPKLFSSSYQSSPDWYFFDFSQWSGVTLLIDRTALASQWFFSQTLIKQLLMIGNK
ncbi:predicted protein [Enterococcus casseliflavus EC10]|nr:predicted protein [Enterococcus casseliflavus EC10]